MTSEQTGVLGDPNDGVHCGTTIASLVVGAAFLSLWIWLLPSWLGFDVDTAGAARWRWIAAGGDTVYVGLRKEGTWDAGSNGSAAKAGGDGAVPVCAESDVSGVLCGLGRVVGNLRPGERGRDCVGVCCARGRGSVCGFVRAADAAKEVWRGL